MAEGSLFTPPIARNPPDTMSRRFAIYEIRGEGKRALGAKKTDWLRKKTDWLWDGSYSAPRRGVLSASSAVISSVPTERRSANQTIVPSTPSPIEAPRRPSE